MSDGLRLFGAIAIRPVLTALIPDFEAATHLTVLDRWQLNPVVRQHIDAGAPFDVVVTNPELVRALVASGRVRAESQLPLGRVSMGVCARPGHRVPELTSVAAFSEMLRTAATTAYASEGTSGKHFLALLERLGLAEARRPKRVPIAGGGTTAAVAEGRAEIGVVPLTSIITAFPAVVRLGRFPEELASYVDFDIGLSAALDEDTGAQQLSDFLLSPALDQFLADRGLERRSGA